MKWWWSKEPSAEKVMPPPLEEIYLYADDDLLARAKKLVWVLGYRGATGNMVLNVYDVLKKYDDLDKGKSVDDRESEDRSSKLTDKEETV